MGYVLLGAVFFLAFANGANDNFKGVATLWGARRVAETISRRITPFDPPQALSANFFGAMLGGFASHLGLPVSTTHVAVGSVLGVGLHRRREANWGKAREIAGGWLITLPVAAVAGAVIYWILGRQQ